MKTVFMVEMLKDFAGGMCRPPLERPRMLLRIGMLWVGHRDLRAPVEKALDDLHALHECVVLVAHLVFPRAESAPRVDVGSVEERDDLGERLVAVQPRRRIAVVRSI